MVRNFISRLWQSTIKVALISGVLTLSSHALANQNDAEADFIANGTELFQTKCSGCHGSEASGTNIAPHLRPADLVSFTQVVREGLRRPDIFPVGMPQFSQNSVSDSDLQAIFDYLKSLP